MSQYYIRPALDDNIDRQYLLSRSVIKGILFIFLTVMFAVGILNAFPLIPWGYGYIYHVFDIVSIVFSFVSAYSRYRPIINICLIIAIIAFIVDGFALGFIFYSVIICYIKSIPSNCSSLQFTYIITLGLSLFIFILSFGILLSSISLTKRANKASKRIK